jgi:hypothetical protein
MATYLDALLADRERMRRAMMALIESEAATVRELQTDVEKYALALDAQIMRLMIYRNLYGESQAEALNAQTDVEEASKPHTAAVQQLVTHQRVLQALQEALIRLEKGESIAGTAGDKLTVADILS